MTPTILRILTDIREGTTRVEFARDPDHAMEEAGKIGASVNELVAAINEEGGRTGPLRNCHTCAFSDGDYCNSNARGVGTWCSHNCNGSVPKLGADNCPGWRLAPPPPVLSNCMTCVHRIGPMCGLLDEGHADVIAWNDAVMSQPGPASLADNCPGYLRTAPARHTVEE